MIKEKILFLIVLVTLALSAQLHAQDLSHRKSDLTITVLDADGNPVVNAVIDIKMKQHSYKFGTQIRDRFISITEAEFNSLSTTAKQNLMPNLTKFDTPRYTPSWQDVENYRQAVWDNFNHVVPTTGMQWISFNNNGPDVPNSTIALVQSNGLSITGASVVWPRDRWPTPIEFRPESSPIDANAFHAQLIIDRLSATGIMGRFSDTGIGPTINEWKLLNEPINNDYFQTVFTDAGIYASHIATLTDFFVRARNIRPNAILSINEYNILNAANDANAIAYRDLVNSLLAAGAPIDRIGVQAHISRGDISKADMHRRIDILAETGLDIEITEFDTRDDAAQLTPTQQQQIFQDVLEVAFENPAIAGFIMWGFWDPGHWRGNGPLFDEQWMIKPEASPWFNLVKGQWLTELNDLNANINGQWSAPNGVFSGLYEITVTVGDSTAFFENYDISTDSHIALTVPVTQNIPALNAIGIVALALSLLLGARLAGKAGMAIH